MWCIVQSECLNDSSRHIFWTSCRYSTCFKSFKWNSFVSNHLKIIRRSFFLCRHISSVQRATKGKEKKKHTNPSQSGKEATQACQASPLPASPPPPHPLSGEKWVKWAMTGPSTSSAAAVLHSGQRGAHLGRVEARVGERGVGGQCACLEAVWVSSPLRRWWGGREGGGDGGGASRSLWMNYF